MVVEAQGLMFGILTDAVIGTLLVGTHDLAPAPAGLCGARPAFIQGVIKQMVAVLDLSALGRILATKQVVSIARRSGDRA